jgi:hypothetical protein
MRQNTGAGDVSGLHGIGKRVSLFNEGRDKLVCKMRMGAAVAFQRARIINEMPMGSVRIGSRPACEMLVFRQIEKGMGRAGCAPVANESGSRKRAHIGLALRSLRRSPLTARKGRLSFTDERDARRLPGFWGSDGLALEIIR